MARGGKPSRAAYLMMRRLPVIDPDVITAANLVASDLDAFQRRLLVARASHAVTFGAYGVTVRLALDREDAAQRLRRRYRALLTTAEPDVSAYAVEDDAGRTHVWSEGRRPAMWPRPGLPLEGVVLFADAVASEALFARLPSVLVLHAAALRRGDRAFAIAGTSTAGKTTTALACTELGGGLYSDERCVVRGGRVLPFPRALNVRAGGARLLVDGLPASRLTRALADRSGATWNDAGFEDLFGPAALPEPAPLAALFLISGYGEVPRSRPIPALQALPELTSGSYVAAPGIEAFATLLGVLMQVRCYELVLGSPLATARHLAARVEADPA